jgi:hypothetical protein
MIFTFVAIGKKYINLLNEFFNQNESFKKMSIVLTNEPYSFNNVRTVHYVNKVFSYFDKLLFSLRICEEYKENVLYVDVDELREINILSIINQIENRELSVLYTINWPPKTLDELNNKRWDLFKKIVKINHNEIETIKENVLFFPKTLPIGKIIYELELLKPIFETMSLSEEKIYGEIGSGEGLALSYVLKINDINIKKINN